MDGPVLLHMAKGIATITLNRPDALNALSPEMATNLLATLHDLVANDDARVIVITGAGRAFCAGGDLKTMQARGAAEVAGGARAVIDGLANPGRLIPPLLTHLPQPVIASINGVAAGWGNDLALACDIRIASDQARFAEAFVRRGLVPDGGGTWTLPRIAGLDRACELIFTGRTVDAAEAERLGIVTRVVPHDQLTTVTEEIAGQIAANAPLAVRLAKQMIYEQLQMPFDQAMQQVALFLNTLRRSEDHQEGVAAFLERREPVFRGR